MSSLVSAATNCHLCFNNTKKLENLRSISIGNDNIPFIQKFYYCVYKTEWLDTNVPINICIQCRNALDVAYAFKTKCMENSERLRIHISTVLQQENASKLIPASTSEQFKIRMRQDIQSEKFVSIPNAFQIQNAKDVPALSPSNENVVLIDLTTEPEEQSHRKQESSDLSCWERKIKNIKLYQEETNTNDPISVNECKTEKKPQIEKPINKEAKRVRIVYEESNNSNATLKIQVKNEASSSFEEPEITNQPINKNEEPGFEPIVKQITEMKLLKKDPGNEHQQTNETVSIKGKSLIRRLENMNNVDFKPEPSAIKMKRKCSECGVVRRNSNFKQLYCLNCAKTPYEEYNCSYCKKRLSSKSGLICHERELHYERKCPYCEFTCFSLKEIKRHWRRFCNKGKQIHVCDKCKVTFLNASMLYNHRRTHFYYHFCDLCGATFKFAASLRKHKMNCQKVATNVKKEEDTSSLPLTFYI